MTYDYTMLHACTGCQFRECGGNPPMVLVSPWKAEATPCVMLATRSSAYITKHTSWNGRRPCKRHHTTHTMHQNHTSRIRRITHNSPYTRCHPPNIMELSCNFLPWLCVCFVHGMCPCDIRVSVKNAPFHGGEGMIMVPCVSCWCMHPVRESSWYVLVLYTVSKHMAAPVSRTGA